ncbi:unnamed protein product, partial [marine sediment metagenome]
MTQVLALLRLLPEIRGRILASRDIAPCPSIAAHALRGIAHMNDPREQVAAFEVILRQSNPANR